MANLSDILMTGGISTTLKVPVFKQDGTIVRLSLSADVKVPAYTQNGTASNISLTT